MKNGGRIMIFGIEWYWWVALILFIIWVLKTA